MAKKSSGFEKILLGIFIFFGIVAILGVLAFTFFVNSFMSGARPFQVSGQAMSPLYKDGTYLMTKGYDSEKQTLNRGEIIIFKYPLSPDKDFIKRIIGLPGEAIQVSEGKVYINDKILDEPYISEEIVTNSSKFLIEGNEVLIPENNYFVMGDNRVYSSDSREWGFVPENNIIGVVDFCYLNCD